MTRLAVTSLSLSHFRSHRTLDLDLDGRPVAIFGPNGAGTTNLVEAVSLLSPGRGLRRAAGEDLARAPERIGWRIGARLTAPDGAHEVDLRGEGGVRRLQVDGKTEAQARLGDVARVLWLTPAMDRLWMEGAAERRRFLDRIALSLLPGHAEAAVGYERAMRERNRLLRDQSRDSSWYEALEAQMGRFGADVAANRERALSRLAEARADGAFPAADLSLTGGQYGGADALSEALRESRRADLAAGRSLVGPHRDDLDALYAAKGVSARLCSTGEQKALLISVILANARAVASDFGAPPILILDEVAAHLDADRRAALFNAVCNLGGQAFMTGTGEELFEAMGPRAQYLRVAEARGESRVETVPQSSL